MGKPKPNRKTKTVPNVNISVPHDGDTVSPPTVSASGSGAPSGAVLAGTMTELESGATILCDSNVTIDTLGNWQNLTFSDVPPGDYVLAVNELDPDTGADAVSITVSPVSTTSQGSTVTPMSATSAQVTGTPSDANDTISGMIIGSKPVHGSPDKQKGPYTITFTKLKTGHKYKIVVYPIRNKSQATVIDYTHHYP